MWPLAAAHMVQEGQAESIWARLHARQALVFGLLASLVLSVLLALPLIAVVAVPAISTGATIAVYYVGIAADVAAGILFAVLAVRFAIRCARGELFTIPLVTPIADAAFRLRRP